jgi:polygalacturonase
MKLFLLAVVFSLQAFAATCDVREFGAKGDGMHLDTGAI